MCAMHHYKGERLVARTTAEKKDLIRRAAEVEGRTVSDYVRVAAENAARETLQTRQVFRLSQEAAEAFVTAMENPPEPTERLIAAARHYRSFMGR